MHSKGKTKETSKSVSVKAERREKKWHLSLMCRVFFFLYGMSLVINLSRNILVDLDSIHCACGLAVAPPTVMVDALALGSRHRQGHSASGSRVSTW